MPREAKKELFWFIITAFVVNLIYLKENAAEIKLNLYKAISWITGTFVFSIGVLNVLLVHPVQGIVYFMLSFIYFPPVNELLKKRFGVSVPLAVKIILGIVIIWFTMGVSDLGDMID